MTARKDPSDPGSGKNPATPCNSAVQSCPAKKKTCSITSQTVATSPANRARTKLGVGEEVALTVTPGPATAWAVTSGDGSVSPDSGGSTTFTAGDSAGSVTVTATCADCTCTITFTVVEPTWTMDRRQGTSVKHTANRPDCGWKGMAYLHPNDVNFYRCEIRELDSQAVTTGSYNVFTSGTPVWHGNYPLPDRAGPWITIVSHSAADGSGWGGVDTVYSGDPARAAGNAPPFNVGTMYFPMQWQWHVIGKANHNFAMSRQEHEIFATGRCESRKGGHTESKMYNDPASGY